MGFRSVIGVFLFLALADLMFVSVRSSLYRRRDGVLSIYMLLAAHELVLLLQLVCLCVLLSRTFWLSAGLVTRMLSALKVVLPLFAIKVFLTAFPCVYRDILLPRQWGLPTTPPPPPSVSSLSAHVAHRRRAWTDGGYGALIVLDLLLSIAYLLSCFHVGFLFTEKTLYAPYSLRYLRDSHSEELAAPAPTGLPSTGPTEHQTPLPRSLDAAKATVGGGGFCNEFNSGAHFSYTSGGGGGGNTTLNSGLGGGRGLWDSVSARHTPRNHLPRSWVLPSMGEGGSGGGTGVRFSKATIGNGVSTVVGFQLPGEPTGRRTPYSMPVESLERPASLLGAGATAITRNSPRPSSGSSRGKDSPGVRSLPAADKDDADASSRREQWYGLSSDIGTGGGERDENNGCYRRRVRPSTPTGSQASGIGPIAPLELRRKFTTSSSDAPGHLNAFAAALLRSELDATNSMGTLGPSGLISATALSATLGVRGDVSRSGSGYGPLATSHPTAPRRPLPFASTVTNNSDSNDSGPAASTDTHNRRSSLPESMSVTGSGARYDGGFAIDTKTGQVVQRKQLNARAAQKDAQKALAAVGSATDRATDDEAKIEMPGRHRKVSASGHVSEQYALASPITSAESAMPADTTAAKNSTSSVSVSRGRSSEARKNSASLPFPQPPSLVTAQPSSPVAPLVRAGTMAFTPNSSAAAATANRSPSAGGVHHYRSHSREDKTRQMGVSPSRRRLSTRGTGRAASPINVGERHGVTGSRPARPPVTSPSKQQTISLREETPGSGGQMPPTPSKHLRYTPLRL